MTWEEDRVVWFFVAIDPTKSIPDSFPDLMIEHFSDIATDEA